MTPDELNSLFNLLERIAVALENNSGNAATAPPTQTEVAQPATQAEAVQPAAKVDLSQPINLDDLDL